ncbi:MAG: hypothetical protein IRZ15_06800 [Bryobacteraceae bacterium]|nr:hypothetical protein [Bryobacteraceae bacterium]
MQRFGLPAIVLFFLLAAPAAPQDPSSDVLCRYLAASSQPPLRGVSMEVDFEAKLPKLKKEGRLQALRIISKLGEIRYVVERFVGDNSIKKDVIARYMQAETQAQEGSANGDVGVTPKNYKFKYKGLTERDGREYHVFQLTPRKKRVGLYKGELWLDPVTCLPVREAGRLVKTPSIFLKKIEFVRDYEIRDGRALPKQIQSTVDTRFWGRAELMIHFRNLSVYTEPEAPNFTVSELN